MSRRNCNARRRYEPDDESLAIEFGAPEICVHPTWPGPGTTVAIYILFCLYASVVLLILLLLMFGARLLRLN